MNLSPVPDGFRTAAIAPAGANVPVTVQCEDKLLFCMAGEAGWREVAEGLGAIRGLEIFSIDGRRFFAQ